MKYQVRFYLNLQEMEGKPDERFYDDIEANSKEEAIGKVMNQHFNGMSKSDRAYTRNCLSAKVMPSKDLAARFDQLSEAFNRQSLQLEQTEKMLAQYKRQLSELESVILKARNALTPRGMVKLSAEDKDPGGIRGEPGEA